jgi:hypothetical protein
MSEPIAETNGGERARRQRLERIRQLRSQLDARWNEATPLARQAAALELARDEVPWLLGLCEQLLEENESLAARLDDLQEQLDARERR